MRPNFLFFLVRFPCLSDAGETDLVINRQRGPGGKGFVRVALAQGATTM